jgi:hypothetical protein
MQHGYKVYGFAGDADFHCPTCAVMIYGPQIMDVDAVVYDREGNEVVPIYSWQIESAEDCCGDCFERLIDS